MASHTHPDPDHTPETHAEDAEPTTAVVKGDVTVTTTTTVSAAAAPKPKPATTETATATATATAEAPKKTGWSPLAIAGAVLGLLLLLGGAYWLFNHNGTTPATPVVAACCPGTAVASLAPVPSTCCPVPAPAPVPVPPPPPAEPKQSFQACMDTAMANRQFAKQADADAAQAEAQAECTSMTK